MYEGWLSVEHSTFHHMDEYRVENLLAFPGGWVAVQHCSWNEPIMNRWTTSEHCYLLDLSLDSRKVDTKLEFQRAGRTQSSATVGRMYMVPPGQTLALSAARGRARSLRCFLRADLVESHLPRRPAWDANAAHHGEMLQLGSGQIEWLLRRMYRELHEPDFATEDMVDSLAGQLAIEIVRHFRLSEATSQPTHSVGGLPPWRMRLIRERAQADLPVPSLAEVAALCGMTVRHLSRAFRTENGQTIGKYVESEMVQRARAMLTDGATVSEVAVRLGYATCGSFSCAFRRATGLLPRDFKEARNS
jgi:AraC family transcriptional regulator